MAESSVQTKEQLPRPNPGLQSLDRLVGTWDISGPDIQGQVTFEWVEGGFFLRQRVDLLHDGHKIKGIEMIGYLQSYGEDPGQDIRSRFYSYLDGMTLDYVYEVEGDTLTIWGGKKGSPAYYQGRFSDDGKSNTGGWVWPGGGYESSMTRVR
jgi:hypothetical protein